MHRRSVVTSWSAAVAVAALVAACASDSSTTSDTSVFPVTTAASTSPSTAPSTPSSAVSTTDPPTSTSTTTTAPPTTTTSPPPTTSGGPGGELVGSGRYPAQPDGVAWPTDEWPTGELPDGVDRAAIDAVVDTSFVAPDQEASMRSVVAVHGGRIVYERYHPLDGASTIFSSWSVAKSVTAALVGIAERDGLLDVAAPAGLSEWAGDERAEITIDDLLRMSSGLEWTEQYGAGSDPLNMLVSPSAADVPIAKPLVAAPGTTFNYSTGTSAILAEILSRALGGPDALDEFITTRLVEPLGLTDVDVLEDQSGTFVGGLGFDTTARDFARFGLLHLRGGVWDGARLLDESWIDHISTPSVSSDAYGGHWWLREDPASFVAQGLFGQQILVVPELDLVVVTTTAQGGDPYPVTTEFVLQFAGTD